MPTLRRHAHLARSSRAAPRPAQAKGRSSAGRRQWARGVSIIILAQQRASRLRLHAADLCPTATQSHGHVALLQPPCPPEMRTLFSSSSRRGVRYMGVGTLSFPNRLSRRAVNERVAMRACPVIGSCARERRGCVRDACGRLRAVQLFSSVRSDGHAGSATGHRQRGQRVRWQRARGQSQQGGMMMASGDAAPKPTPGDRCNAANSHLSPPA